MLKTLARRIWTIVIFGLLGVAIFGVFCYTTLRSVWKFKRGDGQ